MKIEFVLLAAVALQSGCAIEETVPPKLAEAAPQMEETSNEPIEEFYTIPARSAGLTAGARPVLRSPAMDEVIDGPTAFQFHLVLKTNIFIDSEYVVQLSSNPSFPLTSTVVLGPFTHSPQSNTDVVESPVYDTVLRLPDETDVFWRVGAWTGRFKAVGTDGKEERSYIYSAVRRFKRHP